MNKLSKVLLSTMLLFSVFIQPIGAIQLVQAENTQVDIESDLIGYWDFNDGTVKNLVNEAKNGELIGDKIAIKDSEMGQALHFEGDSASYMKIPDFINTGAQAYTISMWYKYNTAQTSNKNTVLLQQDDAGRSLLYLTPSGQYGTYVSAHDVFNDKTVDLSNWQHISFTIDNQAKKVKFFVNGELDSEENINDNLVDQVTSLLIGRHKNVVTDPEPMAGYIDELRVYEKVIDNDEAKAIYQTKKPFVTLEDNLLGYWNFDDGEATNLVVGENDELIGNNISIEDSSHTEMGKSLNYSKGNDSYLKIKDFINTGKHPYSFSMWHKTGDISNNQHTVLLQQDGPGRTLLNLLLDGKYGTYVTGQDLTTTKSIEKGVWQHVVMTVDPIEKQIQYYVNGTLEDEHILGDGGIDRITNLLVGIHKSPSDTMPQQMVGEIDEIRIYDKVIDEAFAQMLYEDIAQDESELEPIQLSVDMENVERTIDDSIFGINHRYAFNGYGMFDPETGKAREDFSKLYDKADFGSIRYPGGTISNLFRWKDSIGEMDQRKKQIHGFYNVAQGIAPNFGLTEIGDFASEHDSELVYVYGLGRGNAQDAADLVEYLNAEVGTNPNGGIEWAKVRADNGRVEPYNVRYFEIGNEMQQDYNGPNGDGSVSQAYWTQYGGHSLDRYVHGGNIKIDKQPVVGPENWNTSTNTSNGEANQVKYMRYANTPPGLGADETFEKDVFTAVEKDSVKIYVNDTEWEIVDNLQGVTTKNAVEVDYFTGEMYFGDGENGNIPPKDALITASYHVEKDGYIEVSKAIRDTMEQINEQATNKNDIFVYAGYESQGFINNMQQTNNVDLYDGMTIHPYSGTPSGNGEAFYNHAMKLADTNGIQHVKDYVNMLPDGKVPVVSEFGIFRSTNPLVRSQTHALYMAKVMMEYVKLGSPYIQKHTLVDWFSDRADSLGPTQQAVIQAVPQPGADISTGEGDYRFFSTPSAHVFEMLNSTFGDEIITNEFNRMDTFGDGINALNALASKDISDNVYVSLVNLDPNEEKTLEIVVNGLDISNKEIEVQTLAGTSFSAENTLDDPDNVSIEYSSFNVESDLLDIALSPHSFTIIKINSGEKEPEPGPAPDKSGLQEVIEEAEGKEEATYTTSSWDNFAQALENATSVYDSETATQSEIDVAVENLREAIAGLEERESKPAPDKSVLKEVIKEAEGKKAATYTTSSWDNFAQALENATSVYDSEEATQSEIDKAVEDLREAIAGLEERESEPAPDKSGLQEVIEEAEGKEAATYTTSSWDNFAQALENATSVYDSETATQSEIDVAVKNLREAIAGLEERESEPAPDKSGLQEVIEEADGKEAATYTTSSWDNLAQALGNATSVYDSEEATQSEIDKAVEDLREAIAGLEEREAEKDPEKDPEEEPEKDTEEDSEKVAEKDPGKESEQDSDKDEKDTDKPTIEDENGEKLPTTATNIGNMMLFGLFLLGLSMVLLFIRRFKNTQN